MNDPFVSVILCAHRTDRYKDLLDAINSLKYQSFRNYEIVLVIDGNRTLYEKIYICKDDEKLHIILNDENIGLSESRNRGIEGSKGNIIAFFDDDAVAEEDWIKELVRMYEERDALAVGGRIIPLWVTREPRCLPQEYYWLIGATHKGFPQVSEVRNTFGSNLSFRADVLRELGGFRSEMGVKGKGQLQGEETEICERMRSRFGKGVHYNQNAVVYHKVFPERLRPIFLMKRAFWQGYSKRAMEELGYSLMEERNFLKTLSGGILGGIRSRSPVGLCQVAYLLTLTFCVGVGYLFRAFSSPFRSRISS